MPNNSTNDKKQPVVNQDLCIGCGICAAVAPEVFAMDAKTGKSKVVNSEGANAEEGMNACPVEAITLE